MLVGRLRETENNTRIKRGTGIMPAKIRKLALLTGIC